MDERNTPTELAPLGALMDPVTGLPGRALFFDHLQLSVAQLDRKASSTAVLVVDIDDFKLVNDGLGPETGDFVLKEVGRRIFTAIRPADTVSRLSADEFGVICTEIMDASDVLAVAQRIMATVAEPLTTGDSDLFLSVGVGMSLAVTTETTATEMVRDAAAALHKAKERGPANHELFDPALRRLLLDRIETEGGLRTALEAGRLLLFYQPEFDVQTGRIVAVEALVRWQHPERGLLEPPQFIGVAERTGLIVPLGAWVLEHACRQALDWRDPATGRPVRLAVNVSARQLEDPGFLGTVDEALRATGFPAESLCLEVTESAVMSNAEVALSVLAGAKELGVKVAIDDFGIGFSSLGQLRDLLPIHQLKVDRSFVGEIVGDERSRAIVSAVILMANSLGLEAVAEGVETSEQLAVLGTLGCDLSQGFHLARPQPPEAIPELLRRHGQQASA